MNVKRRNPQINAPSAKNIHPAENLRWSSQPIRDQRLVTCDVTLTCHEWAGGGELQEILVFICGRVVELAVGGSGNVRDQGTIVACCRVEGGD